MFMLPIGSARKTVPVLDPLLEQAGNVHFIRAASYANTALKAGSDFFGG